MASPSSMIRVTSSQSSVSYSKFSCKKSKEESSVETGRTTAHNRHDRSILHDITNDSPIIGLAAGSLKTPASSVAKSKYPPAPKMTPGSGEALLRGQVKTLLQKVEEDTEFVKPLSSSDDPSATFRALLGHLRSPRGLLAPTPANTPQILGVSDVEEEFDSKGNMVSSPSSAFGLPLLKENLGECQLNRALLFDSSEESDMSELSSLTYQGSTGSGLPEKIFDDECSSIWSTQANAAYSEKEENEEEVTDEDFLDEGEEEEEYDNDEYYEEEEDDGGLVLDDLCDGLRNISVVDEGEVQNGGSLPEFAGKHTRFLYNSDDEIEGEEEITGKRVVSPSATLLKGLPVPEGKHLRFHDDDDDEEEEVKS